MNAIILGIRNLLKSKFARFFYTVIELIYDDIKILVLYIIIFCLNKM